MNTNDYITEIKCRLSFFTTKKISDPLLMTYVNRARHQVQRVYEKLYPEAFGEIYSANLIKLKTETRSRVMNGDKPINFYELPLPEDFNDCYVVLLNWEMDYESKKVELTRINREEINTVCKNKWQMPTTQKPDYIIDTQFSEDYPNGKILICGIDYDSTTTLFERTKKVNNLNTPITMTMYYTKAMDDINYERTVTGTIEEENVIPKNMEEDVISYAMLYCLEATEDSLAKDSIGIEIQNIESQLKMNYEIRKEKWES